MIEPPDVASRDWYHADPEPHVEGKLSRRTPSPATRNSGPARAWLSFRRDAMKLAWENPQLRELMLDELEQRYRHVANPPTRDDLRVALDMAAYAAGVVCGDIVLTEATP